MKSSWSYCHRFQLLGINQLFTAIPTVRSPKTVSPLSKLSHTASCQDIQKRYIFTEEFLGVSLVRLKQEQINKELAQRRMEPADFQKQILDAIPQYRTLESTEIGSYNILLVKAKHLVYL